MIGMDHAYFTVQDESGQTFRPVAVQNIELERIYFWEGRWRREKHPAILAYLSAQAAEMEATRARWPSGIEWIYEELIGLQPPRAGEVGRAWVSLPRVKASGSAWVAAADSTLVNAP